MNINALHPSLTNGVDSDTEVNKKLKCHCETEPVEVTVSGDVFHNHLCGCSACWKPQSALFSQIAVVAKDKLTVTANQDKLRIVNENSAIKRHACKDCNVHMVGKVTDPDHHYYGIDFVHIELAENSNERIEFAGYVSSLIESGVETSKVEQIRGMLAEMGITCYDTMSPDIMDVIAYHQLKMA